MVSNKIIILLLVINFAILVVSIWEKNLAKSMYWLGALILQIAVLIGMK